MKIKLKKVLFFKKGGKWRFLVREKKKFFSAIVSEKFFFQADCGACSLLGAIICHALKHSKTNELDGDHYCDTL